MRRSFRDLNKGTKGTSRWTTLEEVRQQYPSASLNKHDEIEGQVGVPVLVDPDRKNVYYDPNNTNSKVMGGTQTGKTQFITYPTIDLNLRSTLPDSMVINDIKGDITRRTWEHPRINGRFNRYCFNLVNPRNSLRFNPIYNVGKYWKSDNARAQTIIKSTGSTFYYEPDAKDPIWNNGAQAIYETIVSIVAEIATTEEHPEWVNLNAVTNFYIQASSDKDKNEAGQTLLEQYISDLPTTSLPRKLYNQLMNATNDQKRSYETIFNGKLNFLNTTEMSELVSANDLDFNELVYPSDGKPSLLFVIFPYTDSSFEKILGLFYNQLYQTIATTATKKGGKFDRRLHTIFEEFTNTPRIDNIAAILNVGLEAGNKFTLFSQSSHQTTERYGQELGKVILQSAGNSYYIMSEDNEDANNFSRDLGDATVIEEQRSGDPLKIEKSYTEIEGSRSLMQASELQKLLMSEAVLNRTKLRKDLKGNDIRPYPIKAVKKESKHLTKNGNVSKFSESTNLLGAFEYLFAEAGGDFDDKGKGLDEFDFRVFPEPLASKQRKGWKIKREFNEEDYIIPQDIFDKYIRGLDNSDTDTVTNPETKDNENPTETPKDDGETELEELAKVVNHLDENVENHNVKVDERKMIDVYDMEKLVAMVESYMGSNIATYIQEETTTVGQFADTLQNWANRTEEKEKVAKFYQNLSYLTKKRGG